MSRNVNGPNHQGGRRRRAAKDVGGSSASGLHDAYGAEGMPVSAFCDVSGHILDRELQALPEAVLRQKLDQLFGLHIYKERSVPGGPAGAQGDAGGEDEEGGH